MDKRGVEDGRKQGRGQEAREMAGRKGEGRKKWERTERKGRRGRRK